MLVIRLLRLHHWIKNLFLFIPIFFAGDFFNVDKLFTTFVGFIGFGFAASTIYILNDIMDVAEDRLHPRKSTRPIASGEVSMRVAYSAIFFCVTLAIGIGYYVGLSFLTVMMFYITLNVGYSLGLKNVAILDFLILAAGFEIRVIAGGIASEVPVTQWLMVMFFLLALFLAIAKRREDLRLKEINGVITRKNTSKYNIEFLNASLIFSSSIIVVAYIMYCLTSEIAIGINSKYLVGTAVFVVAGILRYLQIALVENNAGSPTKIIYTDKFIIITVLAWMITFFLILY